MYTIMGATGNIGSKLIELLLKENQRVRAVGRSADRLKSLVERGAEAAELVAYCNLPAGNHPMADLRAKNGYLKPFGILSRKHRLRKPVPLSSKG